ncbi:hypothetical protein SLA2020_311760 [Shorea laevis]
MAILRNIKNFFVSIITFIPHSDSPPPPSSSNIDPESQQPQPPPSPEVQLASTQLLVAPSSAVDPQSLPQLPPPSADNATSFQASPTPHSSSINRNGSAEHPTSHSITVNHQSQQLPAESLIAASLTRQRDQQWESAIISFCLTSAIEISLYKFQQTESSELPFPILLLSCANLFTFALLVVAKLISDNSLTTTSKALQQVTIILAFAQLCYTVAIPFTLILKCTVWAIFAITIIVVFIWKYFHF